LIRYSWFTLLLPISILIFFSFLVNNNQNRRANPLYDYFLINQAKTFEQILFPNLNSILENKPINHPALKNSDLIILLINSSGDMIYQNRPFFSPETNFSRILDVEKAKLEGKGISQDENFWFSYRINWTEDLGILRLGYQQTPWDDLFEYELTTIGLPLIISIFTSIVFYFFLIHPFFWDFELLRLAVANIQQHPLKIKALNLRTQEFSNLLKGLLKIWLEAKEKNENLTRQNLELETLLSGMKEGVLVVDEYHLIHRINSAAKKMFNLTPTISPNLSLIEATRSNEIIRLIDTAFKKNQICESELLTPDNRRIHATANLIQVSPGNKYILVVLNDFTEQQRLEEVRKDFVANVSHELKTPITAIKASIETIMKNKIKKEDRKRFLKMIEDNAERMANIIEDLLTLSRLEKDLAFQKIEEFNLIVAIREAITLFESEAQKKSIQLQFHTHQISIPIRGHQRLAVQAIGNLISNAIKYSDEKTMIIIRHSQNEHYEIVEVIDQGIGIPQKDLERIFERFYRVDKGRSRDRGGTGLGLSIVKHIMLQHGGKVEVLSQPNQGSKFSLYFPR
jgi:two-component system phosphate regulon sensor histidine kinase PhoR